MTKFIIRSEQPTGSELAKPIYDVGSRRFDPRAVPPAVEHFGVLPNGRQNYLWWNTDRSAAALFDTREEAERVVATCVQDFGPRTAAWNMTVMEA